MQKNVFVVGFLTEVAVIAATDGTREPMRAWPRAGWSRVQHFGVLPGVCARWSTDLSGQLDAPPSLHCSLLNPVTLPSDLLLFRSSGTVSPPFNYTCPASNLVQGNKEWMPSGRTEE